MKFGLLYEHQLPRPWDEASDHRLLKNAIEQVELPDDGARAEAGEQPETAGEPPDSKE